jgi:tetratricopeptide (TPR) repeat protein
MRIRRPVIVAIVATLVLVLAALLFSFWVCCSAPLRAAPAAAVPAPAVATDSPADRAIRVAEMAISREPRQSRVYIDLAQAYMRKARASGDAGYYGRAETAVRHALQLQPGSVVGLRTLAWIQTGKHEFRDALATAERLRAQLPNDPLVQGLIGDAALELGEYQRAEDAWQKMLELQPGLASYSRAAYLRELYGDLRGATALQTQAVQAGSANDPEPLAWCLVQLGNVHFNQGRLEEAEAAYQKALAVFPQYHQAFPALARVRGAQQRYPEALALYRRAIETVPAPDTVAALGDLLALIGKTDEAEKQYALVEYIERVKETTQVMYNRQLALFYADHDRNLDEAITLAEAELSRRRDIYTYDTLAWAYYKSGRYTDAEKAMTQALRLDTQDALLFFHAGMIAHQLGKSAQAKEDLQRALTINPYFHPIQAKLAEHTLREIDSRLAAAVGENKRR